MPEATPERLTDAEILAAARFYARAYSLESIKAQLAYYELPRGIRTYAQLDEWYCWRKAKAILDAEQKNLLADVAR